MKANDAPPYVIGAVVILTVIAGIWAVGGPATGAQEKRDKARMSDLSRLGSHVHCLARADDKTLPESLPTAEATITACTPAPRMADPFTEQSYTYERLSDTAFRVCAGFENPELIALSGSFDKETGCLNYQYNP